MNKSRKSSRADRASGQPGRRGAMPTAVERAAGGSLGAPVEGPQAAPAAVDSSRVVLFVVVPRWYLHFVDEVELVADDSPLVDDPRRAAGAFLTA